jgi:hypothetical protein
MATTTGIAERIEVGLRAVLAEVEDLPTVGEDWATLPDGNRASIALDWAHLMADYFPELEEAYRSDEMTLEQRSRYRTLRAKLRAASPMIERLRLYRPPVPLGT